MRRSIGGQHTSLAEYDPPSQMLTTQAVTRSRLIRLGLGGGAALVAGGAGLGAARPARAQAAAEPTEGDLATVRLLASGELLAQAFYTSALASKRLSKAEAADLGASARARAGSLHSARRRSSATTAPLADDFEFAFPKDAFTRRGRMLRLGTAIETALAGTYASAAATASTLELRTLLAQVAVSEAQHVAVLNRMRGGAPAPSFPELSTSSRRRRLSARSSATRETMRSRLHSYWGSRRASPSRGRVGRADRPDHRLRRRVSDRRLPEDRLAPEVLVRGVEHARPADPAGSAGRRVRLRGHGQPAGALRVGALLQAAHLRDEQARRRLSRSRIPAT